MGVRLRPPQLGTGDQGVAVAPHREPGRGAQRHLDRVGDLLLVSGDGFDVDEGTGQGDRVGQDVRVQFSHVG